MQDAAVAVLEKMDADGKLGPVDAWTNEKGETVVSWPEPDDVLGCYLDMLGLNGRPIVECAPSERAPMMARRQKAHETRG